jgi:hypothetical protein
VFFAVLMVVLLVLMVRSASRHIPVYAGAMVCTLLLTVLLVLQFLPGQLNPCW